MDYINPIQNIKEMEEISKKDIQSLIEAITTTEEYDFILLDLESSMHDRVIGSMESSDRIFWIVQDDIQSLHKTQVMFNEYIALSETNERRRNDSIFILNREIGPMVNRLEVEGAKIQESLPYIPQWKSVSSGEQLLSSLEFKQSVNKLVRFFTTIDGVETVSE
jgi:MinD-like ATPase involved in chromosome partitioning or flagellar assembly